MYTDLSALSGDSEAGVAKMKINRENEYSFAVGVNQVIFSGTVFNAIKASGQYRKLTDFIYDASHQEIMTLARKAYYQTILLKLVWNVSLDSENNARENFEDIQQAFDNGLVSEFNLLQAEVRYKDKIPQATEAERNYRIALVNIKNLAGLPVDREINLTGDLDSYPEMPPLSSLEEACRLRPDFNALLWEEELRKTGVSAEKSAYFPTLSGSFTYAYSAQSDRWRFDNDNNSYILGLNLSLPIFTGGARGARVQKAKIELNKTRLNIARTRETIEKELRSIRLRLDEGYTRIQAADATVKTAQKAFKIAETTSRAGLATQLELKDSRIMLDQATTGYYAAVYEYLDAYFDWQKAIGSVE